MKIGIIGTGVFSVSIANLLAQNEKNTIVLWSENKDLVSNYQKTNTLDSIFKERTFSKNIILTNSYEEAVKDVEVLFLMTSINYIESVCTSLKEIINPKVPICIGTKGITLFDQKPKFAYEIGKRILKNPISILSGPTFAEDVLALAPIAFTIACKEKKVKMVLQKVFAMENVKVVFTNDFNGTSICGCVKNIYAIGSGILAGLGYKESTLAYYLTSVYKELETILYHYDSSLTTLHSLAGFGDLVATCFSVKSRNYNLGLLYGAGKSQKEINTFKEEHTIEGFASLEKCITLFKKKHIKTPLLTAIFKIVNGEEKAKFLPTLMKDTNLNSIY